MKKSFITLLAASLYLTSCVTQSKESPLQARIDSLESKLYYVTDTLQQLRKQEEQDRVLSSPNTNEQQTSSPAIDAIYESNPDEPYLDALDALHGDKERYVFGVIEYMIEGSSRTEKWYSDVSTERSFSRDAQAAFIDDCIRQVRLRPEIYNKPMRVLYRKAYMSFSYAKASQKLSQLRDGL